LHCLFVVILHVDVWGVILKGFVVIQGYGVERRGKSLVLRFFRVNVDQLQSKICFLN
jgi:hypothetical protein